MKDLARLKSQCRFELLPIKLFGFLALALLFCCADVSQASDALIPNEKFSVVTSCFDAEPTRSATNEPKQEEFSFSRYFIFWNPKEALTRKSKKHVGASKEECWSEDEKQLVQRCIGLILRKHPGILRSISSNGVVRFVRMKRDDKIASTIAKSNFEEIIFFDPFFLASQTDPGQAEASILHEFVHIADTGRRVSHTSSWIQYVQPRIAATREVIRGGLLGCMKLPVRWEEIGLYGSTNLQESLAEVFCKSDWTIRPQHAAVSEAARAIFEPSEEEIRFRKLYCAALRHVGTNQLEEATKSMRDAKQLGMSIYTDYVLAQLALLMKDDAHSKLLLDDFEESLRKLGVSTDEDSYLRLWEMKAGIDPLWLDNLNKVLTLEPDNERALGTRIICHLQRNNAEQAAEDFYNLRSRVGLLRGTVCLQGCDAVVDGYNKLVKGSHKFSMPEKISTGTRLQKRALFMERRADAMIDSDSRNLEYATALKDYRASLKYYDAPLVEGLYGCGRVSLKLKNKEDVEAIVHDLEVLHKPLVADILRIGLLQGDGKLDDSERHFRKFVTKLLNASGPEYRPLAGANVRLPKAIRTFFRAKPKDRVDPST